MRRRAQHAVEAARVVVTPETEVNRLLRQGELWAAFDGDAPWDDILQRCLGCGGWSAAALLEHRHGELQLLGAAGLAQMDRERLAMLPELTEPLRGGPKSLHWLGLDVRVLPVDPDALLVWSGPRDFAFVLEPWLQRSLQRRRRDAQHAELALELQTRLKPRLHGIEAMLSAIEAMAGTLDLQEQEELALQAARSLFPQATVQFRTVADHPVLLNQQRYGKPLLVEDVRTVNFAPLQAGYASFLAVPLWDEGWQGSLVLHSHHALERKDQDLLALLLQHWRAVRAAARIHALWKESQAQLMQSSKMAAVGVFAAGLAHELNTPLAAIMLAIESAERYLPDRWEKSRAKLEQAATTMVRAQGLVEKLLYFSRDSSSARQTTDLDRCVVEALDLCRQSARLDGIEIEWTPGQPPPIWANPQEIEQIVVNLVLNACDAVRHAGPGGRVAVRTGSDDPWLEVHDTGPGVSPELATRIFEPFYTTKDVGQGTGLGLSVSLQIAQAHGGTLELASSTAEGAVFRLRLPKQDA